MPRCYMVKKGLSPLGGTPPCSPSEASVAPPCYTPLSHPSLAGPRPAQYAEPPRHVGTQCEEPRSGDFAENCGGASTSPRGAASRYEPQMCNGIYAVLRAAEFTDLQHNTNVDTSNDDGIWCANSAASRTEIYRSEAYDRYDPPLTDYSDPRHTHKSPGGDYAEPRTVRYLERDFSSDDSLAAENAEPRSISSSEYDEASIVDYVEHNDTEGQKSAEAGIEAVEYAELQIMGSVAVSERSAADTEAAHDLLSLAASVPPLPPSVPTLPPSVPPLLPSVPPLSASVPPQVPATVLTVLASGTEPVLPLYTYALQSTSIYIIADEPANHNLFATTMQALTPLQQVEYSTQPQVSAYIAYQPGEPMPVRAAPPLHYPSHHSGEAADASAEPASTIELAPVAADSPVTPTHPPSVLVPTIDPVPLVTRARDPYDTDSDYSEDAYYDRRIRHKRNVKKYDCNECNKSYATSSNLSRHKQTHRSLDSHEAKRCSVCGKRYVSMPALAMHVLTHRKGHVCGVCGKLFSRPWLLRGHLRSHTGEKPYLCPACPKSFADRSNLRAHLQTHSSDKTHRCDRCNKYFALKSYLHKHQEMSCQDDAY